MRGLEACSTVTSLARPVVVVPLARPVVIAARPAVAGNGQQRKRQGIVQEAGP